MIVQGTQLEILRTIANLQEATSSETVEDTQLVEALGMATNMVKTSLQTLADDGYVRLADVSRLSGPGYMASLTVKGQSLLEK